MNELERYMKMALEQAEIAEENGEVPIGAVVRLPDGRSFAAHNAPISRNDPTAHAEILAIRSACAAVGNYRLTGAELYVTLEPCAMCAGAIVHARIAHLIYGADDPKAGAVHSVFSILTEPRLNHRPKITGGVLGEACGALLREFFRKRRGR